MQIFKNTISYKMISLLDEFKVERKYINAIIFSFYLFKFITLTKINIKRKLSPSKKIDLFFKLIKERIYLQNIVQAYNIDGCGKIGYTIINNILLAEISYGRVRFNIEYGMSDDRYTIYITVIDKCFNANEENLKVESIYDTFNTVLDLLLTDIILIFTKLLKVY